MDDNQNVSYLAFESSMARMERVNKRLWIVLIILIVALLGTNAGWLYYESTMEGTVVTQEVDAQSDGDSDLHINTVGGDLNGGESSCETDGQN